MARTARDKKKKPKAAAPATGGAQLAPNPRWYAPVMLGLMIIGLIWVVTFYLTAGAYPVRPWGNWNLGAGFGLIIAGFLMTTNWR